MLKNNFKALKPVTLRFFVESKMALSCQERRRNVTSFTSFRLYIYGPRSDKRDLLTIKVKSEISTEKERPSCCEQLQKI